MENWKPVVGYEGLYEVSDCGNVRGLDRPVNTNIRFNNSRIVKGKLIKSNLNNKGYYTVCLCKDGVVNKIPIHRIVATAFIPNPNNERVVNHISGIKTDNRVENLEWVSYRENHWHARTHGLLTEIGQHNNVAVRCVENGKEFASCARAAEWLIESRNPRIKSYNKSVIGRNVRECTRGRTPKAYGYHWEEIIKA